MITPRYKGVELPIYPPDTPVMTLYDLKLAPNHVAEVAKATGKFVRAIDIAFHEHHLSPIGMNRLLTKTDEELSRAARLCDADVIGHDWGLYPIKNAGWEIEEYVPSWKTRLMTRLPKGYILVAEMDYVEETAPIEGQFKEAITDGQRRYYAGALGKYLLCDIREDQFMVGRTLFSEQSEQPWLVDIEPRFQVVTKSFGFG